MSYAVGTEEMLMSAWPTAVGLGVERVGL